MCTINDNILSLQYTTNDTSVTLMSGLIPDTQYSVWVTAHNTAGSSGQSQEVIFTTDKSGKLWGREGEVRKGR